MSQARAWLMGAVLLVGCGRSGDLIQVEGRVYYKGEPIAGGTVVFTPDRERGGVGGQAWATVGSDGRFLLASDGHSGASVGWHRVTVAGAKLPQRYRDPELSGQRFEVRADRANSCELHLE